MKPDKPLPLPPEFTDVDTYVDSLLHFGTSCTLLRTLCGGIHINDFFNRDPDLYTQVLPQEWREYFKSVEIFELLDLLMREDLETFQTQRSERESESKENDEIGNGARYEPPQSLIRYIKDVRRHLLNRDFKPNTSNRKMDRKIAVGMNVKKVHEVENFSHYVDGLTSTINANSEHKITHLVDFGAGVNYLGRALASQPYNRNIIAIESRAHVVEGAKKMDVLAKISEKTVVMRNKKEWRKMEEAEALNGTSPAGKETPLKPSMSLGANATITPTDRDLVHKEKTKRTPDESSIQTIRAKLELPKNGQGTIQYVKHLIKKSNLEEVIDQIVSPPTLSDPPTIPNSLSKAQEPGLMVISLHSCGNLLHHGIRTLTANPSVRAVALVGCCYNLMTERLNPPTYKIPFLREHPRLEKTSNIGDADGFPMSTRFLGYRHKILKPIEGTGGAYETPSSHTSPTTTSTTCCPDTDADTDTPSPDDDHETGIRLNITARMMAVQAPQNWTPTDSSSFFTRHFYRALLQRLFLDKGILDPPPSHGTRPPGKTAPIIIGTLRKSCYASFVTYVRGVVGKLSQPQPQASLEGEQISETGRLLQQKINILTDDEIQDYVTRFAERKKELSVIWSLMAFSAGVVEAMVLVDRWTFLREQEGVVEAWVEPVFEYGLSPRNLVVVGIKG